MRVPLAFDQSGSRRHRPLACESEMFAQGAINGVSAEYNQVCRFGSTLIFASASADAFEHILELDAVDSGGAVYLYTLDQILAAADEGHSVLEDHFEAACLG